MKLRFVFPALLLVLIGGCTTPPPADQASDQPRPRLGDDGAKLFTQMVANSNWCRFESILDDDPVYDTEDLKGLRTLVIKKSHLDVPFSRFEKALNNLEEKHLARSPRPDRNYPYTFRLYDVGKDRAVETGAIFLRADRSAIYMFPNVPNRRSGVLEGIAEEDGRALLGDVEKAALKIDNAIEALDVENRDLLWDALHALTLPCFRQTAKKAVPRMERFLDSSDKQTREWAAKMILKIAPDHKAAKIRLEKKRSS